MLPALDQAARIPRCGHGAAAYDMAPPGNQMTRGDSGTFWETATLWQALLSAGPTLLCLHFN